MTSPDSLPHTNTHTHAHIHTHTHTRTTALCQDKLNTSMYFAMVTASKNYGASRLENLQTRRTSWQCLPRRLATTVDLQRDSREA